MKTRIRNVTPDGHFVMVKTEPAKLNVVLNWFEELKEGPDELNLEPHPAPELNETRLGAPGVEDRPPHGGQ